MSSNISHQAAKERGYLAAAHNERNSEEAREHSLEKAKEVHLKRTGSELDETLEKKDLGPEQPGLAETEEGRKERAFIAAAHREGRDEDKKLESLHKASELHEKRTGEPLPEAEDEGVAEEAPVTESSESSKREYKTDGDTLLQNQERGFLGAAHRKDRDDGARAESLEKASEIHEELTGEPLAEASKKSNKKESHSGKKDSHSGKKETHSDKKEKAHHKDHADNKKSDDRKDGDDSSDKSSKDETHLEFQERAFVAAAHRKGRDAEAKNESLLKASEIHQELTGEPLPEAVEKSLIDEDGNEIKESGKRAHDSESDDSDGHKRQKLEDGLASSADGRQERAFIAAAHREGRSEEGKLESLKKASELHEKRTGEPLPEAVQRGVAAQ